jgi:hypothetical protein
MQKLVFFEEDYSKITAVNEMYGDVTYVSLDNVTFNGGKIGGIVRPFVIVNEDRDIETIHEDEVVDFIKETKINELDIEKRELIEQGFTSDSTGYFFGFSREDQDNFMQVLTLINSGLYLDEKVEWNTKDVGLVYLTINEFKTVIMEAQRFKQGWINKYREVCTNIKQMTNDACKMSSLKAISLEKSSEEVEEPTESEPTIE